jgi:hypothetical protein
MRHVWLPTLAVLAAWGASTRPVGAQTQGTAEQVQQPPPSTSASELAKKTQNPVSDLTNIPLQSDFNLGVGPENRTQYVLNIQPVFPALVSRGWMLVTRAILPLIDQPVPLRDHTFGVGDSTVTVFASPRKEDAPLSWGFGPVLQIPTATSSVLGSGKWGAGPSFVAVAQDGPWVLGALANQIWSFAGESDREGVNAMLLQPFVYYNLPDGWALGTSPIVTANWKRGGDNRWTLPIGATVSKVIKTGGLPMQASVGGFWNALRPDDGPDAQIRATVALLIPR